jgi:hypothetical protein
VESQVRFLLWWYALDETGRWLFHHAARRLAKGPIAHETPVATPDGWVAHGELLPGDPVYAADGSLTLVTAVHDEVIEACFEVTFRDGHRVVCTAGHRWPVGEFTGAAKRIPRELTVAEMYAAGITYDRPLTIGATKARRGGVARFRALPTPAIEGAAARFPVPPYVLGYWLGDGDSDNSRITVHIADLAHIAAQFDRFGVEWGEPKPTGRNTVRVRFGRGWAKTALRDAGVLNNKHIPLRLLRSSLEQRWELLQGIVDSDGHVGVNGQVEVCVMAGRLADDIFSLAVSLGLMPTRKDAAATLNGRRVGIRARIRFSAQPGEVVAALPRKAERTLRRRTHSLPFSRSRTIVAIRPVPARPARCITVAHPAHRYLVGEGNVPTCNSGKSPFAAVQALIEFCAPVRLLDFDKKRPGGVRGKPVDMPLVQIAATAESQTANTMRMVRAFAAKGSKIAEAYHLDVGKTLYYKPGGGQLEVITSSASAAEGAEATFNVADETEHWTKSNGGVELAETLDRNLAKSGSRMLETANAWQPGLGSVAETTYDAWLSQVEGRTKVRSRILYDCRQAPSTTDMSDEKSLMDALRFVYDDCWWVPLESLRDRIWDLRTKPAVARMFYLNQPTASSDAWVSAPEWAACLDITKSVADRDIVVLGFDGSRSRAKGVTDATALVGCRVSDGHLWPIAVWEQPDGPQGADWQVPETQVDAAVRTAFSKYNVVGFYADPAKWESYIASWEAAFGAKLKVKSTRDHPIEWWVTGGRSSLIVRATEQLHSAILNTAEAFAQASRDGTEPLREVTHDGSYVLTRHVLNARQRDTRSGIQISKESPDSPRKIDAAFAAVLAWQARLDALAKNAGAVEETFVPYRIR